MKLAGQIVGAVMQDAVLHVKLRLVIGALESLARASSVIHTLKCTRAALWAVISPIIDSSERGDSQHADKHLEWLGHAYRFAPGRWLARLVGILAGLACLGVIMYLYVGHSYALHPSALSRSDSMLLCRIAANERLYVEGCRD